MYQTYIRQLFPGGSRTFTYLILPPFPEAGTEFCGIPGVNLMELHILRWSTWLACSLGWAPHPGPHSCRVGMQRCSWSFMYLPCCQFWHWGFLSSLWSWHALKSHAQKGQKAECPWKQQLTSKIRSKGLNIDEDTHPKWAEIQKAFVNSLQPTPPP